MGEEIPLVRGHQRGLTKTCRDAVTRRDAVTVNDPAGDALSGLIFCCMAAAPGHRLDAVTRRDAVLADAGTTKQGRRGSTCIEDCLVCVYYLHLSVPASIACEGPLVCVLPMRPCLVVPASASRASRRVTASNTPGVPARWPPSRRSVP